MSSERVIPMEEVAQHTTEQSCWLAINNKVFDVTRFLGDHPGGKEPLRYVSGRDATDDFTAVNHTNEAKQRMLQFCIGSLDPKDHRRVAPSKRVDDTKATPATAASTSTNPISATTVVLIVLALGVGYLFFA